MHLKIHFIANERVLLRLVVYLLTTLTTYTILDIVETIAYINDPTTLEYGTLFIYSFSF